MKVTQEIAMVVRVKVNQSHSREMLKRPEKTDECTDNKQWPDDTAQCRGESGPASSLLR